MLSAELAALPADLEGPPTGRGPLPVWLMTEPRRGLPVSISKNISSRTFRHEGYFKRQGGVKPTAGGSGASVSFG
jgi:hypothetical protein